MASGISAIPCAPLQARGSECQLILRFLDRSSGRSRPSYGVFSTARYRLDQFGGRPLGQRLGADDGLAASRHPPERSLEDAARLQVGVGTISQRLVDRGTGGRRCDRAGTIDKLAVTVDLWVTFRRHRYMKASQK